MAAQVAKLALLVVVAQAAQSRPQQQQRQSEELFLQSDSSKSRLAAGTPFPIDFFSGDADKMAEMPPYDHVKVTTVDKGAPQKWEPDAACAPVCNWRCGPKAECNQAEVCEPQCMPPQCKTICKKSVGLCETRCSKPQCAIVCPEEGCPSHNCPRCGTVCSQPNCTTICGDDCHSVCEKPQCAWKCHQVACSPKPTCVLKCDGMTKCGEVSNETVWMPTAPPGSDVAGVGEASLDPKDLVKKVSAPPPWTLQITTTTYVEAPDRVKRRRGGGGRDWPMKEVLKPLLPRDRDYVPQKSTSSRDQGPPPLPGGHRPVRDLKRRWAVQDAERSMQRRSE